MFVLVVALKQNDTGLTATVEFFANCNFCLFFVIRFGQPVIFSFVSPNTLIKYINFAMYFFFFKNFRIYNI